MGRDETDHDSDGATCLTLASLSFFFWTLEVRGMAWLTWRAFISSLMFHFIQTAVDAVTTYPSLYIC